ncbi:MAG: UvrB/UvrC motif-containing protein [Myxococcaceae bacterium]|nr:UvrB/UvrC motif-containing protein [Myxococcaceae bacterium]
MRERIRDTEKRMMAFADEMEFEKAAAERDRLIVLREMDLGVKPPLRTLVDAATERQEQRPMGRKSQPRKYRRKR